MVDKITWRAQPVEKIPFSPNEELLHVTFEALEDIHDALAVFEAKFPDWWVEWLMPERSFNAWLRETRIYARNRVLADLGLRSDVLEKAGVVLVQKEGW